jgi:hypothetical protein
MQQSDRVCPPGYTDHDQIAGAQQGKVAELLPGMFFQGPHIQAVFEKTNDFSSNFGA